MEVVDPENMYYSSIDGVLYSKDASILLSCPSVTRTLIIPNSVTTIGERAFEYCSSLTSVTIPNSVTTIEKYAFRECDKIATVYCQSRVPPQGPESGLFHDTVLRDAVLYVPKGRLSAYEAVDPWRNFFNIEEMEFAGVDNVGNDNETVVTADGGAINLGAEARYVEVYNIGGQCVFQGIANRIESLAKGVYIVKVGTVTTKVII